jgi:hypothetical protein
MVEHSVPYSLAKRFDPSAIMTRAWELARTWHAEARSFHFAQQRSRPLVAVRPMAFPAIAAAEARLALLQNSLLRT